MSQAYFSWRTDRTMLMRRKINKTCEIIRVRFVNAKRSLSRRVISQKQKIVTWSKADTPADVHSWVWVNEEANES